MGAVIEAIDQELDRVAVELTSLDQRQEQLQTYRTRLETAKAELDGQGTLLEPIDRAEVERVREAARPRARKSASRKPAAPRRPAPKPPPSPETKPVASPAVSSPQGVAAAASGESNRGKGKRRKQQVLDHLREVDGWAAPSDIATAIGEDRGDLSSTFRGLVEEGAIKGRGATKSREYHIGSQITEPDSNGARTGPERRIVEAIGSVRLTASEIRHKANIDNSLQAASVLQGLVARGVLVRDNEDGVPLYAVASA